MTQPVPPSDSSKGTSRAARLLSMCEVSSETSRLVKVVVPFARAASRRALLDTDLEPGRCITPLIFEMGARVRDCMDDFFFPHEFSLVGKNSTRRLPYSFFREL